jgi:hypothetical protein
MLSNDDLIALLFVVSGTLLTTTVGFAVLWVRARERALRARLSHPSPDAMAEDVTRLVQAVDAIAIEVERISEAQRFTALTLAERSGAGGGPKRVGERIITPH